MMSRSSKNLILALSKTSKKSISHLFNDNLARQSLTQARFNSLVYLKSQNFFSSKSKPEDEKPAEKTEKQTEKTEAPPKTEEKSNEQKKNNEKKEEPKNLLEKLLEMEKSKENEVKIKTLFQQKDNEIKEKQEKISELEKKIKRLEENLDESGKKIKDLRNNLIQQIDEVNLSRQRMEKEKKDMKDFAISKFAKEILDVVDNLERAVTTSAPEYEGKNNDLFEGVNMTFNLFTNILERNAMKKINPLKEKFNPNLHEALFEITDEKQEPGTVGYVAQYGYTLNDRVLRAARVGVIKGTPKPAPNATENAKAEKKDEGSQEKKESK